MANGIQNIRIGVQWGTNYNNRKYVEVSGEVLDRLLKIDPDPMNAVIKVIYVATQLREYGPKFKVQNMQKGGFDVFEWKSK